MAEGQIKGFQGKNKQIYSSRHIILIKFLLLQDIVFTREIILIYESLYSHGYKLLENLSYNLYLNFPRARSKRHNQMKNKHFYLDIW